MRHFRPAGSPCFGLFDGGPNCWPNARPCRRRPQHLHGVRQRRCENCWCRRGGERVSYTGSTAVGRQIMADGGAHQRLVTRIGGKTPMIVFDDADSRQR
ncbi:aldehyde dehydrogenase family protein [Rhodococcus hoagii]|nr:aldehyde dehydrogenase family protein [Prescottella equi]